MGMEQKLPGITATGTESEPVVAGVALFSEEPAQLARFYEKVVRIPFDHRPHPDGREHWIASRGGVQVEIKALRTPAGEPTPDAATTVAGGGVSRSEISFHVPGVSGSVARAITTGGRIVQKAETHSWGTFAVVLDPDGNRIGLFEAPSADDTTTSPTTTEGTA